MIPVHSPYLGGNERKYVMDCLDTNWISSFGPYNKKFEKACADYLGMKHAVGVVNGTCALHLCVLSLGIGPGDEVIVSDFTMAASAFSVAYTGAKPIFVDSEPLTCNIDPKKIEEKITQKTKAIMVVHIYGHPCDMDPIMKIAKKHNLYVIEDVAEAHGALYNKKQCGTFGDISAFSYYANKIITTGEGGMVVTNDDKLAEKARFLENNAFDAERRHIHTEIGYNYRMPNIQAAIGLGQIERIEETIKQKRSLSAKYNKLLKGIPGLILPYEANNVRHVYWMYFVRFEKEFGMSRDEVKKKLLEEGIETRYAFTGMHKQPCFNYPKSEKFPVSERLEQTGMYLPSAHTLTDDQLEFITNTIKELER